jgi:hypothetical protein
MYGKYNIYFYSENGRFYTFTGLFLEGISGESGLNPGRVFTGNELP